MTPSGSAMGGSIAKMASNGAVIILDQSKNDEGQDEGRKTMPADMLIMEDVGVVQDLEDLLNDNDEANMMINQSDDESNLIGGSFVSASAFSHDG